MNLEASDLNDGAILAATVEEAGPKGSRRFHITLPDGHKMCSEWIGEENVRKARVAWLDSVKAAVTSRVQAARRAKQPRPVVPAGTSSAEIVTPVTNAAEPLEYVRGQMMQAGAEVERLTKELGELRVALDEATRRHQQWITTHNALSGQENANVK